jgi:uncharacterized membrane protein
MSTPTLDTKAAHHPAVNLEFERRAANAQLRLADRITAFAGSMTFVYIHVLVFATWMIVLERSPWPTLTLAVSLEAIFLSTFVMIGQNRQAAFQQDKADHDYATVNRLLVENTELTRDRDALMQALHTRILDGGPDDSAQWRRRIHEECISLRGDGAAVLKLKSCLNRGGSSCQRHRQLNSGHAR